MNDIFKKSKGAGGKPKGQYSLFSFAGKLKKAKNKNIGSGGSEKAELKPTAGLKSSIRSNDGLGPRIIKWFYILIIIRMLVFVLRLFNGFSHVKYNAISINTIYYMLIILAPFLVWIFSTQYEYWNYTNRKMRSLILCIINFASVVMALTFIASCMLFVPLVLNIPLSRDITPGMILNLARGVVTVPTILFGILTADFLISFITKEEVKEEILYFKWDRNVDRRKNVEFAYDMTIIKEAETGNDFVIFEADRRLHSIYDGGTGTGKTATCVTTSVADDLDQKIHNVDYAKKECEKLLKNNQIHMKYDFDDSEFSISNFEATNPHAKKQLKKLAKLCVDCGITVLAPNETFADEIYELAHARKMKVNRLDPIFDKTTYELKDEFIGFNPFYISPAIDEIQRKIELVNKGRIFADVMQAISEMDSSGGEAYFTTLNHQFAANLCILLLKTFEEAHGRQPNPADLQTIINNFNEVIPYLELLKECEDAAEYKYIIDFVELRMLGAGRQDMQKQTTGVANNINELLANPLFKNILCADDAHSIDLDRILENNEITVVNYALELGEKDSKTFGLFFLLSFNSAVFRRDINKRTPHYVYIDEFPVLLHPSLERAFSLFRQYNVSYNVCIQSFSQFSKSKSTEYMKDVLLSSCATQIIFGRAGLEEMTLYEKLAGKVDQVSEQTTISQSSITEADTSLTYSTREGLQKVNALEGRKIREKDFAYVTISTVRNSAPVPMFEGKMSFIKPEKRTGTPRYIVNWHTYFKEDFAQESELVVGMANVDVPKLHLVRNAHVETSVPMSEIKEHDIAGLKMFPTAKVSTDNRAGRAEGGSSEQPFTSEKLASVAVETVKPTITTTENSFFDFSSMFFDEFDESNSIPGVNDSTESVNEFSYDNDSVNDVSSDFKDDMERYSF